MPSLAYCRAASQWRQVLQANLEVSNNVLAAANHNELRAQHAFFMVLRSAKNNPKLAGQPIHTERYIAALTPHIAFLLSIPERLQDLLQFQSQGLQGQPALQKAQADFQHRLTCWSTDIRQVSKTVYVLSIANPNGSSSSQSTSATDRALTVRAPDSTALQRPPRDAKALQMIYPRQLIQRPENSTDISTPQNPALGPPLREIDRLMQLLQHVEIKWP